MAERGLLPGLSIVPTGGEAQLLAHRWGLPLRGPDDPQAGPLIIVLKETSTQTMLDFAKQLVERVKSGQLRCAAVVPWSDGSSVESTVRLLLHNQIRVLFPDADAEKLASLGRRVPEEGWLQEDERAAFIADIESLLAEEEG